MLEVFFFFPIYLFIGCQLKLGTAKADGGLRIMWTPQGEISPSLGTAVCTSTNSRFGPYVNLWEPPLLTENECLNWGYLCDEGIASYNPYWWDDIPKVNYFLIYIYF